MAPSADIGARPLSAGIVASTARADANLFGLLGLLLLLLVFFIMLSSAARPDPDRAQPAIQSLRSAFSQSFAFEDDPALTGGETVGEPRIVVERLTTLLRSALPLAAVATAGDARRLYVDLPAGGFFRTDEARLSPLARERLRHVASIIDQATGGTAYSLTLAVAPTLPAARARLAALAAMLAGGPLGASALSAAIDSSAPADQIRFVLALGAAAIGEPAVSIGKIRIAPSRGTPWLITFVDLVGLLLAFFVLQFAMTSLDGNRLRAMFGTASADAPPIADERADRDAILGAQPLDEMIDSGYLAAVLRDRLASAGNAAVAVRSTESGVLIELDGLPRSADAASARAAAVAALRPVLDLLRRLEAGTTLRIAVADPVSEIAWQSALVEGEALAADLVAAGLVSHLRAVAVATPGAPGVALLVADPAGGDQ